MSRIAPNPISRPVDTYAAPEVRLGQGGESLMQLSQSLARFNPKLMEFAERRAADAANADMARASADVVKYRLQNMKDFRSAVERGDIKESDTPWYLVSIKQRIAQNEARTSTESFRQWYESPEGAAVRFSDSPEAVGAALDEHLGPTLEGRSQWETEAIVPEYQRFRSAFLKQHADNRSAARSEELSQAYDVRVRSLVADDRIPDIASEMAAQALLVGDVAAGQMTARSIMEQAEVLVQPGLAREVLDQISVGGEPLSKVYAGALQDHEDRVDSRIGQREFSNTQAEKRAEEARYFAIAESMRSLQGKSPDEIRSAIEKLPLKDQLHVVKILGDASDLRDKLVNQRKSLDSEQAVSRYITDFLSGADPNTLRGSFYALVVADPDKAEQYSRLLTRDMWPLNTPPATALELTELIKTGSLTTEWLAEKVRNNAISENDFGRWAGFLSQERARPELKDVWQEIRYYTDLVEGQVMAGNVANNQWEPLYLEESQKETLSTAQQEFYRQAVERIIDSPEGLKDRDAILRKTADEVAARHGGFSYEERLRRSSGADTSSKLTPFLDGTEWVPLTTKISSGSLSGTRVANIIRNPDGSFTIRGQSGFKPTSVDQLPRMFQSPREMAEQAAEVMRSLNIDPESEEADRWRKRQADLLKNKTNAPTR